MYTHKHVIRHSTYCNFTNSLQRDEGITDEILLIFARRRIDIRKKRNEILYNVKALVRTFSYSSIFNFTRDMRNATRKIPNTRICTYYVL